MKTAAKKAGTASLKSDHLMSLKEEVMRIPTTTSTGAVAAYGTALMKVARKADRAKRTLYYACLIAIGFGVLATVICWLYAEPIVAAFTDESETGGAMVVLLGGQYLRGYVFDCIFAGIHFSFSGYFCACGKSLFSFLHNIAAILLVRVPGAYLTSQLFPHTLLPMGLATAAGSLLSALICLAIFRFYFRRSMVL